VICSRLIGKYESLKYWSGVKARVRNGFQKCGVTIGEREFHHKEKIDFVKPLPRLVFRELCKRCGEDTVRA